MNGNSMAEADRSPRGSGSEWPAGYLAGKQAYEVAAGRYRSAADYLLATGAGVGRSHSWVDGFKTGWSVARDD
jgi:hypothetical protein